MVFNDAPWPTDGDLAVKWTLKDVAEDNKEGCEVHYTLLIDVFSIRRKQ